MSNFDEGSAILGELRAHAKQSRDMHEKTFQLISRLNDKMIINIEQTREAHVHIDEIKRDLDKVWPILQTASSDGKDWQETKAAGKKIALTVGASGVLSGTAIGAFLTKLFGGS